MNATATRSTAPPTRQALVVDDDPLMQAVLSDMLHDLGMRSVNTAGNGSTGIDHFDRCHPPPDLVLCDLNMPGNDGFQFMEQLGNRHYTGGVIVVSGMDTRILNSASLMARFHRLNILATLKKPVDGKALSAALVKLA